MKLIRALSSKAILSFKTTNLDPDNLVEVSKSIVLSFKPISTCDLGLKENFNQLKSEWTKLDDNIKFFDLLSVGLILLFGFGFILVNLLNITMNVTNAALLIFPLILSGYIYVLRTKLEDNEVDNQTAIKEFYTLTGITIFLIVLTFIYSLIIAITLN